MDNLTDNELQLLTQTSTPIGKIFKSTPIAAVNKVELRTILDQDNLAVKQLRLVDGPIFKKTYRFQIGDRTVGVITECFNEQTLLRD